MSSPIGSLRSKSMKLRLKDREDIVQDRIFITHTKCDPEVIEQVRGLIKEFQPGIKEVFDTTAMRKIYEMAR